MAALGCERGAPQEPASKLEEAAAQQVPPGFQEELVLSGHTEPTALRFAPDGRVFVAEKSGLLWAYPSLDATANPVRVVDLRANVHNYWDRGLLGIAVHPEYPAVPHVYVLYTHDAFADGTSPRWGTGGPNPSTVDNCPSPPGGTADGCVVYGRLSRIELDPATLVGTEVPLLSGNWCQQYPSHSVGDLRFGQDGYLYVSAGDGASFNFADFGQDGSPVNPCGDPPGGPMTGLNAEGGAFRSQDLLSSNDPVSFDGSLLRLDVSGPSVVAPPDNPLVGNAVPDDDFIVATGLRNPFRMTVRPGTNELWIADVGWNAWEEINRVEIPTGPVENFGWPCYEGNGQQSGYASRTLCQRLYSGQLPANMSVNAPFYTYSHSQQVVPGDGCGTGTSSITGLAFNTSPSYPSSYANALFFADGTRRCIWTMFAGPSGTPDPASRAVFVTKSSGRVVDLQMGPDGKLYYVDFDGGSLYRIAYYAGNTPPVAVIAADPTSGPVPLAVEFDASGSSDEESGSELAFAWDLDGDGAFDDATGPFASFTYERSGQHVASVRVTDGGGLSRTASITIVADNTPPVPVIDLPLSSYQWSANELVSFAGHAIDSEDGLLPPEQLSWSVLIHHCATLDDCHTHSVTGISGVASGTFEAPDHDYPAFLELRLTANDSSSGFWWDNAFRHRLPLTLSGTLPSAELVDVPVLVTLAPGRFPYAQALPNGADLRFTDETGVALPFEIDTWNPAGTSTIWVKLPRVDASSRGSRIFLYYGNPNATDAQAPAAVWANGYRAVWHLGPDLGDSTGNGNVGTPFGAVATEGRIGGAFQFDGTTAYLNMGAGTSLALAGNASFEAWVKVADSGQDNYGRVLCKKTLWDATTGYDLEYNPGLNYITTLGSGADYVRGENVDLDTNWHFLSSSVTGSTGRVYVNGVDRTTDGTVTPIVAGSQPLHIGRRSGGGDYFRGIIDEVRVAAVPRSAAWMAFQNASMRDGVFGYGAPEQKETLSATTSIILMPKTVDFEVTSSPPGLVLAVGSDEVTTPFGDTAIDGSAVSVSAPLSQELGGVTYEFASWSDGGAASHLFVPTASAPVLTAVYLAAASCTDGVQNGGEIGVDCGGPCPPCENCEGCDDANACTADVCHPEAGCQHVPVSCDDGNACTADACDPVTGCQNTTISCDDGNACTADACDPTTGCQNTVISCDDGNHCTADACDPATGCQNTAISCDDGNACTADACDPTTGCQNTAISCDDGNECTADSCNPQTGCVFANTTGPCADDGDACTDDVCSGGTCTHPDNGTCQAGAFQESGGMVVMEAENFHTTVARANHGWVSSSGAGASGGQVLTASPNNGAVVNTGYTTGSPELAFQIAFTTTGTYHVWLRGRGPDADADSCHAGLDGAGPASADRITGFGTTLGWSKTTMDGPVATLNVTTPGVHTFNVWMREDGFVLDKILLTTNANYTPSGAGPAESPRSGGGGCTSAAQCDDGNPCTADTCSGGACQNTPVANGTTCPDDGSSCTNDVCNAGVCTHPSNDSCNTNPCAAYCSNPTTFSTPNYQSNNLGTNATCHQTTANLNGGVCGNFASGRTLSVNGQVMTCNNGNWSALPAKVNGGYCIYTNAGNHPWAYFATW